MVYINEICCLEQNSTPYSPTSGVVDWGDKILKAEPLSFIADLDSLETFTLIRDTNQVISFTDGAAIHKK